MADRGLPEPGQAYRHYKGLLYVVVCLAYEEASGAVVVVYRNVESGSLRRHYTRPLDEFLGYAPTKDFRFDRSRNHDDFRDIERAASATVELETVEADHLIAQARSCVRDLQVESVRGDFAAFRTLSSIGILLGDRTLGTRAMSLREWAEHFGRVIENALDAGPVQNKAQQEVDQARGKEGQ